MSTLQTSKINGIRDIFVAVTTEDVAENRSGSAIGYGLSLARATGAHLTVQSASWQIAGDDAWLGVYDQLYLAEDERRLDTLARAVAERAAGDAAAAGIVCATESPQLAYPDLLDRLVEQARLHDLTVLDAAASGTVVDNQRVETVLFGSGRPALIVPPGAEGFTARRILVAWDGSAQAARAVNDALPFLKAAEKIEVISVVEETELFSTVAGAEIAPHLARHGIDVTVNTVPREGSIADVLRRQATLFRADLLVLGAYGHSRLRDLLFGGVTRALVGHCPVPLLLAH